VPPSEVQAQLGHARIGTALGYAELANAERRRYADRVAWRTARRGAHRAAREAGGQTAMAPQRTPRPGRLVLVHAETEERLYAGPPAAAAWAEGRRVVEVAGKRYRVVPWSRKAGRDLPSEGGPVPTVTYRVLPEAPPGGPPRP
jgi:hypothetical protein